MNGRVAKRLRKLAADRKEYQGLKLLYKDDKRTVGKDKDYEDSLRRKLHQ